MQSTIHVNELHPLLEDVQLSRIFPDGKTFVDCRPRQSVGTILEKYRQQKNTPGFDLKKFVLENFDLPVSYSTTYQADVNKPVEENIEKLWDVLARNPHSEKGTLIPLPFPYIVPGGRFGEIYYWDSYFTMLGLKVSGKSEMVENMIKNFSYLIDRLGYIPNGNRSYFIGRSQPPFYALMVQMLAEIKGNNILIHYLPSLEKEYEFWMQGSEELNTGNISSQHSMLLPGGEILNRYWDQNETPRPESYREDVNLSHQSAQRPEILYRHLRAGAESGWDYSSRWFKEKNSLASIHTTDILPIDLNCLLYNMETTIANGYRLKGESRTADKYQSLSQSRKEAIIKYCWNDERGFYFDYDHTMKKLKEIPSLAGMFPLFFNIATTDHGQRVATMIKEKFLKPGGVVSTLDITGQQWDAPNGWAPLQWITIRGLENYGYADLAAEISGRWIQLNTDVFKRTGKLMEKYNVIDTYLEAGGGEYPGQDGFGWTNGVFLALSKMYQ